MDGLEVVCDDGNADQRQPGHMYCAADVAPVLRRPRPPQSSQACRWYRQVKRSRKASQSWPRKGGLAGGAAQHKRRDPSSADLPRAAAAATDAPRCVRWQQVERVLGAAFPAEGAPSDLQIAWQLQGKHRRRGTPARPARRSPGGSTPSGARGAAAAPSPAFPAVAECNIGAEGVHLPCSPRTASSAAIPSSVAPHVPRPAPAAPEAGDTSDKDDGERMDQEHMFHRLVSPQSRARRIHGRAAYVERVLGISPAPPAAARPVLLEPQYLRRRSFGPIVVTSVTGDADSAPLSSRPGTAVEQGPAGGAAAGGAGGAESAPLTHRSGGGEGRGPSPAAGAPLPPRRRPWSAPYRRDPGSGETSARHSGSGAPPRWRNQRLPQPPVAEEGAAVPPLHPGELRVGTRHVYCPLTHRWDSREALCAVELAPARELEFIGRLLHGYAELPLPAGPRPGGQERAPSTAAACQLVADKWRQGWEGGDDSSENEDASDQRLRRQSYFVDVAVYTVAATYGSEWNGRCPHTPLRFTAASVLDLPAGPLLEGGYAQPPRGPPEEDCARCLRLDTPDPCRPREVQPGAYECVFGRRNGDAYMFEELRRPGGSASVPPKSIMWQQPPRPQCGGWLEQERQLAERMDAFTHFTFCLSRHRLLVLVNKFCNEWVLEVSVCLADAQSGPRRGADQHWATALHGARAMPGRQRMARWLRQHQCGVTCRQLRLPAPPFFAEKVLHRRPGPHSPPDRRPRGSLSVGGTGSLA